MTIAEQYAHVTHGPDCQVCGQEEPCARRNPSRHWLASRTTTRTFGRKRRGGAAWLAILGWLLLATLLVSFYVPALNAWLSWLVAR